MCPDPQLLSIYLDDELPSPWKEKLQSHFTECPKCNEKYENLKKLKSLLNDKTSGLTAAGGTEQELLEAKERVWSKIESGCRNTQRTFVPGYMPRYSIMRRHLSIPVPVAAAAAVVILLLSAFWLTGPRDNQSVAVIDNNNINLAAEMDKIDEIPVMIPAADMSEVLQYLAPDGANVIIIQLPENHNFLRAGEPAIIRAADFSQNNSQRSGHSRNRGERNFREVTPGDENQKDESHGENTSRRRHQ